MPSGTPLTMKCPKCRRGMYTKTRAQFGCRPTGKVGPHIVKSRHQGHGGGGPAFRGYPGQVKCTDCGHVWFSTHPSSGRKRVSS